MSRNATVRLPMATGICVSGLGISASISHSRVRLSCGDAAPPSTKGSSSRSCRTPRSAGVALGEREDVVDGVALVPHQCVEPRQRLRTGLMPPEVECRTDPRGDGEAGPSGHFIVGDGFRPSHQPGLRSAPDAHEVRSHALDPPTARRAEQTPPRPSLHRAAPTRATPRWHGHAATALNPSSRTRLGRAARTNCATRAASRAPPPPLPHPRRPRPCGDLALEHRHVIETRVLAGKCEKTSPKSASRPRNPAYNPRSRRNSGLYASRIT